MITKIKNECGKLIERKNMQNNINNIFNFHALSAKTTSNVAHLLKKIYKVLYIKDPKRKDEVIFSLRNILYNTYVCYKDFLVLSIYFEQCAWTPILNKKGGFNKNPGKYGKLYTIHGKFMDYNIHMDLFNKLEENGYITILKGYKDMETNKGYSTKIMNTEKLESLFEEMEIHEIFYSPENLPKNYLILRSKKDE